MVVKSVDSEQQPIWGKSLVLSLVSWVNFWCKLLYLFPGTGNIIVPTSQGCCEGIR